MDEENNITIANKGTLISVIPLELYNKLVNDYEKLVNIMYRLDISESKFNEAHQLNDLSAIAENIAQLVWERELEKRKWRTIYSNSQNNE